MFSSLQNPSHLFLALAALCASACTLNTASLEPTGNMSEPKRVGFELRIGDLEIDRVEFQISGPALGPVGSLSGLFELNGDTIWERVTDLPVGTGYHLILIARGEMGRIVCQSEADFDVYEDQVTKVDLVLTCGVDGGEATGSVEIDGTVEVVDNGICGDGVLNEGRGEQCDDGNTYSGDGCSSGCTIEFICEALPLNCSSKTAGLPPTGTGTLTVLLDETLVQGEPVDLAVVMDDLVLGGLEPGVPLTLHSVATTVRVNAGSLLYELDLLRFVPESVVPHTNWHAFGTAGIDRPMLTLPDYATEFVAEIAALEADVTVGDIRGTIYCTAEGSVSVPIFESP